MEGTAPDPTCLLVGAPDVGKSTLIGALQTSAEPKSAGPANYTLRLDTKYYTADVAVQAITTQQQDKQQQLSRDAWEQLQALVLVFDASNQASFASVQNWADARDTDSIEVKLLVANKVDTLQQSTAAGNSTAAEASGSFRPQWLQEAMSWCVDEGYEYVEAAAGKPAADAALQLDGEQQGVARVLAALQAHMWPGMVQKDWQPKALPDVRAAATSAATAVTAATDAGTGSSSRSSFCKDQGSPCPAAADAIDAAAGSTAGAGTLAAAANDSIGAPAEQQQHADMQPLQAGSAAASKSAPRRQQQQRSAAAAAAAAAPAVDDDEADFDLDDFEQMMKQLQGELQQKTFLHSCAFRSACCLVSVHVLHWTLLFTAVCPCMSSTHCSVVCMHAICSPVLHDCDMFNPAAAAAGMRLRLSHLPDAERRAAAADMALRLASMWGLGEEEGSSEEEEAGIRADGQQQLDVRK
jgi:GTP-binding protein EngB required for normal cell division